MSFQTKADCLTPQSIALLGKYRQRWMDAQLATAPANRRVAEEGARLAYTAANLAPPHQIIWCESPIAIEKLRKENWYTTDPGGSVKTRLIDSVLGRVHEAVQQQLPYHLYALIAGKMATPHRLAACGNAVNQAVLTAVSRLTWGLSDYATAVRLRLTGAGPVVYTPLEYTKWGQHDSRDVLGLHQFLHDVLDLREQTCSLAGLWQVAMNAGWMVPHERVCWLSERPSVLSVDDTGRLHAASGPALRYPDGWSHYSWKGVPVPQWVIERPETITARSIERERNVHVKRCMIDIMTAERYVASGAPMKVATDATGILWRREWNAFQAWAAVEVVNGSPEPDGTYKHYFLQVPPDMRTPTEAVAWTYGLSPERYAELVQRT